MPCVPVFNAILPVNLVFHCTFQGPQNCQQFYHLLTQDNGCQTRSNTREYFGQKGDEGHYFQPFPILNHCSP